MVTENRMALVDVLRKGEDPEADWFRWGVLRWYILAEESSDKTVMSARLTPQFGVKIVVRPYSRWVAECLPKAFHPSQQDPTEPTGT